MISGELQMLSQPMHLVSAEKRYNQKYATAENSSGHDVMFFAYPKLDERIGFCAGAVTTF
jgi:hypothetical protein